MGSKNTRIKRKMIAKYGTECWIDKLHLRPVLATAKYTSKGQLKRMKQLTYHHILEKSKGGKATEENGALLSAENHAWFHQQTAEVQRKLNQIFQEYKRRFNEENGTTMTEAERIKYEVVTDFDKFIAKARKYSRSRKKKQDAEVIAEGLEEYYEGEER